MQSNERSEDETMARFFGITETERTRVPVLSDLERRAYQAAWRLDRESMPESVNSFYCPSTRRAKRIDHMARIIREEMGR